MRFPELIRNRIEKNNEAAYDLINYVANWPKLRISHWDALLKARAIENHCYVVCLNRRGSDSNGMRYSGNSVVINPNGEGLVFMSAFEETSQIGELSFSKLLSFRKSFPF